MEERIIPASQLIINDDNSAFHIHLKPEQIKENIIMVGDPGRVKMVASFFDEIDYDVTSREFHTIGGKYKGKEIMCISHGIGSDNIEIVMTEIDILVNIDLATRIKKEDRRSLNIVRVGTSGALQDDLKLGDFVVAEKATGFDGILNFYKDRDKVCDLEFEKEFCRQVAWDKTWAMPYTVDADPQLVDRISSDDMIRGCTIASVGFYAPQGREIRLKLKDPDLVNKIEKFKYKGKKITNFEMESACLQGMAKLLSHKALTVCCIIAQRRKEDADTDYKPRIEQLIKIVLDRI